jgi:hypothetical protein
MFPICVGHAHAFELAIDHALTAINASVAVIFQNEPFGGAIQDDQLDGFRGTVLGTQTATRAKFGIKEQLTAITLWRRDFLFRIHLRGWIFEEGFQNVPQHRSNFHEK